MPCALEDLSPMTVEYLLKLTHLIYMMPDVCVADIPWSTSVNWYHMLLALWEASSLRRKLGRDVDGRAEDV